MNVMLEMLADNLGMSIELILLLMLGVGSLIFFGRDMRIGSVMLLISSTLSFMFAYQFELNYVPSVVVMFISIIILAFTLYASGKAMQSRAII